MAYSIHSLELEGLETASILSVQIRHRPGEHGVMELEAVLGEGKGASPVHETASGQKIALYVRQKKKRKPLFYGIIVGLEVYSMGKGFHVKVRAYTVSYQMDIRRKSRSFQDTSTTMGALAARIAGEYGGEIQTLFADRAIGEIAVQYDETDWQFLKRMLSARHIPLVCSEVREDLCLYLGVAQIPAQPEVISAERVWKDANGRSYWEQNGIELSGEDVVIYQLKLDDSVPLYSQVAYRKRDLPVARIEYRTIGSAVYEYVTLRKKAGILQEAIYPANLAGSALEGTILDISGENVRIHLKIDDGHPGEDCYWFPYATPSASSDGSGWYCMPEKGDRVRVYFPTKKPADVFAISAVSTYEPSPGDSMTGIALPETKHAKDAAGASGTGAAMAGVSGQKAAGASSAGSPGGDRMGDPSTKYLRVPGGHELKLSPSGIQVLCSGGSVRLEVLKEGRINLYAQDSIQICANEDIQLDAGTDIHVQCSENASFASQKGGGIHMNEEGKLILQGTEVHLN